MPGANDWESTGDKAGKCSHGDRLGEATECPLLAVVPGADPWPLRLQQRSGIRLSRGEVVQFGQRLFAIVAFDGRNDGYLCWECGRHGKFDITLLVCIDREKAHRAPRDLRARREVPKLPPLDHTGRILGTGGPVSRKQAMSRSASMEVPTVDYNPSSQAPSGCPSRCSTPLPKRPMSASSACFSRSESAAGSGTCTPLACFTPSASEPLFRRPPVLAEQSSVVLAAPPQPPARGRGIITLGALAAEAATTGQGPTNNRPCSACLIINSLHASLSWGLANLGMVVSSYTSPGYRADDWHLGTNGQWEKANGRAIEQEAHDGAFDEQDAQSSCSNAVSRHPSEAITSLAIRPITVTTATSPQAKQGRRQPEVSATGAGFQIVVSVVKPPGWEEVLPYVRKLPVSFDERGIKECMTVKMSRWSAFVDRQRVQLVKEIQEMQTQVAADTAARAVARAMATKSGESLDPNAPDGEEDLTELERLVDRIADWKDLSLYCGKSISMATTSRGNEMKIFVMAFAEREDGGGIDFMRVSYSKCVEVRPDGLVPTGMVQQLGRSMAAAIPFLASRSSSNEEQERQWVQLLQRPDIAKFTIALAFKDALEDDGIKLSFSEACLGGATS